MTSGCNLARPCKSAPTRHSVNTALTSLAGLAALETVAGDLSISFNEALTDIDGLSALTFVESLRIVDNDALTNVDGLSGVTSVWDLEISENASLEHLDGLSGLTAAEDVQVVRNPSLASCAGLAPLLYEGTFHTLRIEDNAPGCNAPGDITSVAAEDETPALPETLTLDAAYPNPFTTRATLRFGVPEPDRVRVAVYDVLGRVVAVLLDADVPAGFRTLTLEAAGWPSGTYLVRLEQGGQVRSRMVTVRR